MDFFCPKKLKGQAVSTYAMTYRAANGKRVTQHLLAIDRQAATRQAFDLAERLTGAPCGFGIAPVKKGHACS